MLKNHLRPWKCLFAIPVILLAQAFSPAADSGPLIARIKAVGAKGAGNVEAANAWRELVRLGPDALLDILPALDNADPIAANWLRAAVDAIAEQELQAKHSLPARKLETFVLETKHAGFARRLAYEWLAKVDASAPGRLLPGMLDDPGQELRREAVEAALKKARLLIDKEDQREAIAAYRELLSSARDPDQVDGIAKTLKGLGEAVDLPRQFGFLTRWMLIGPFDNTGQSGFQKAFAPEERIDLSAEYPGKKGATLRWIDYTTEDPHGLIDLNKAIGKHMGATGYAFAAVTSTVERPVQLRAGSNNAVKIFLNGKEVYFRDEYHHGMRMDQHRSTGTLKAGRNEILIKVCQNEQSDDWAQNWSFQLRVCDQLGGPVPLTLIGTSSERSRSP
jgi:hypothetical protein